MSIRGFLHPDQYDMHFRFNSAGHQSWAAYEAYTGPIPFLLAGLAAWRGRHSALVRSLVCTALFAFVLILGQFAPWAPWTLVTSHVPGMSMFRAPYRFAWVIVLCLGVLSVIGGRALYEWALARWPQGPRPTILLFLITVALGVSLTITSRPLISDIVRPYAPPHTTIDRSKAFTQQTLERYWVSSYPAVAANFGVLNAFRGLELPNAAREETKEAYLEEGEGRAFLSTLPNVLVVDLEADRPCWLLINQNYHRDWIVEEGPALGEVTNRRGLIAVRVPQGRHRLWLRYRPRAFPAGLAVSAVSLLLLIAACAGISVWRRRTRGPAV